MLISAPVLYGQLNPISLVNFGVAAVKTIDNFFFFFVCEASLKFFFSFVFVKLSSIMVLCKPFCI